MVTVTVYRVSYVIFHAVVTNSKGAEQYVHVRFGSERGSSHVILDFQQDCPTEMSWRSASGADFLT